MNENHDLFEVIYNCRAMRKLDEKEVPEELLIKLIDAANQAASGSNMQAARYHGGLLLDSHRLSSG